MRRRRICGRTERAGRGIISAWRKKQLMKRVLVRWFNSPATKNFLRITIPTDAEIDALVQAARHILAA